jgi:hypothetical protein
MTPRLGTGGAKCSEARACRQMRCIGGVFWEGALRWEGYSGLELKLNQ